MPRWEKSLGSEAEEGPMFSAVKKFIIKFISLFVYSSLDDGEHIAAFRILLLMHDRDQAILDRRIG